MSIARTLAHNTAVQIAGKVVSTILGVITVGLMTRYLGQAGFGMYSTANAFLQFFGIILDFGLNVIVVQMLGEHAGDEKAERQIVSATFTLRIVSAFAILGIAPFLGLIFPQYPWELKLAIFALWGSFFSASLNQIVIGVQQRHFKMHIVAAAEIAGRIVLLGGILLARALNWGLVPIVLIVSLGGIMNCFINYIVARRYASFTWNPDFAFWKKLLSRSWPIGLSILFNLIYFKADTLILSLVRSQAEVGIYGAAYRVLEVIVTVPFMYAGVLLPIIAKAWATGQKERFATLMGHSYDAMTLIAAPLVAGTIVLATKAMVLVSGKDFAESGDVLRILILAAGVIFFGTISSYAVVTLNAQRKMIPVYITVALVTLVGYLALIPTYGLWAAAWLTVFSETCVAVASTYIAVRGSGMRWKKMASFKAIFAAIMMAFAIWPFRNANILLTTTLGAVVYVGLVLATGAVSKGTLKELLAFRRSEPSILENPLE